MKDLKFSSTKVGFLEVTGLSPYVTEKQVYEFFSCCGTIEHLEILSCGDHICTAYVTFKDAYAVETAVLLSGATIGSQRVSISRLEAYVDESVPGDNYLSKETQLHEFVSTPGEAVTVAQQAVTSLINKGYVLSKDALIKAKALDESYQVSSTAAAKMVEISNRIGLTDRINSSVEAAKSVDKKYHVSDITITVASFTGRTVAATANAVVNSSYFAKGAHWVSGILYRASKAAADLGNKGLEK